MGVQTKSEQLLPEPVQMIVETVRRSLSLQIGLVGVLLIVIAYLIGEGVWAALLPIWGAALVLMGSGIYLALWWIRKD